MKAEITVTRTPGEIPHEITLSVELDAEGNVFALPVETVGRIILRRSALGFAQMVTDYDLPIATKGFPFELEPEEIEEAKKAIASNQAAYEKMSNDYILTNHPENHFPLAGLSPHEEGK